MSGHDWYTILLAALLVLNASLCGGHAAAGRGTRAGFSAGITLLLVTALIARGAAA